MQNKKNNKLNQLKNWLFKKPVFFALSFFVLTSLLWLIYALFQTIINIESTWPLLVLMGISFIVCTWYTIKKLPHEKVNQHDFVAITNGATLISLISVFVTFIIMFTVGSASNLMLFYLANKTFVIILFLLFGLFSLYLIGLAICNIYIKYKRATSIGIAPWKVILSMPFAFLLMWTPGYLLNVKDGKNNLEIKCKWYSKLHKWVMANSSNLLFTFLFLILCRGMITGLSTFILYASLLVIYALWYTKYKSDFVILILIIK